MMVMVIKFLLIFKSQVEPAAAAGAPERLAAAV